MINSSQKNKENDIGKCMFDFNVLQVISDDKLSSLLKVRSKKNNQIYAMKKSNMEKAEKERLLNYLQREGEILQSLTHENICKFYNTLYEGKFQYIIMEYVEGENLLNFLNANKLMGTKIKEDKLMKIFLGCMNGLQYIHSKNVIHRNIKPINIIMDDNSNIKILDFKYSLINDDSSSKNTIIGGGNYLAPELSRKSQNIDYDNKIDVYSMGVTFCSLAYFKTSLPDRREEHISKELHKIICNMLEPNPAKRPSSSEVYDDLKALYIKKDNDKFISSISSGIRGLASFPNFYDELKNQNINDSTPMTKQFLNCIELLKELTSAENDKEKEKKWYICLYDFKEFLLKSMKYNEEIEPIHIINFILSSMHQELNNLNNNDVEKLSKNANKEEAYQTFINYYNKRFKSFISDKFFGTIKTKSMCRKCNSSDYFFHYLYLIPFNIKILSEKLSAEKKGKLNIYDAFDCLNRYYIQYKDNKFIHCEKCQKCTERIEFKQFYDLSNDLILFFDRGEKCKYKTFVNFEDKLNLKGINVEKFQSNNDGITYDLYYIISRIEVSDKSSKKKKKEKYIVYTKDSNENKYINNNDGELCDLKDIKTYGDIIALFYYCKEIIYSKGKSEISSGDNNPINDSNAIVNSNNNHYDNNNNNNNYNNNNYDNNNNNYNNNNYDNNNNNYNNNNYDNNNINNNYDNNNYNNNNNYDNNNNYNNNYNNMNNYNMYMNQMNINNNTIVQEENLKDILNNFDSPSLNRNNMENNNNYNMNNINNNNNNYNMNNNMSNNNNNNNNYNMNNNNNNNMNNNNNYNMNNNNYNNNNYNMNNNNNYNMSNNVNNNFSNNNNNSMNNYVNNNINNNINNNMNNNVNNNYSNNNNNNMNNNANNIMHNNMINNMNNYINNNMNNNMNDNASNIMNNNMNNNNMNNYMNNRVSNANNRIDGNFN